jgi:hypothetical protein
LVLVWIGQEEFADCIDDGVWFVELNEVVGGARDNLATVVRDVCEHFLAFEPIQVLRSAGSFESLRLESARDDDDRCITQMLERGKGGLPIGLAG